MAKKVIITAALAGAGMLKSQNPHIPYTPEEFAEEAHKAFLAGASMVHVHGRTDDGEPTHDIERIRDIHDAIKERTPELIVNLTSAVGPFKTPEERIRQVIEIRPEMASLNTNSMNFASINRKTGEIVVDYLFDNTFTMLQDFGRAMESNGVKPEIEVYDMGGLDNVLLIKRQGFFSDPMNFNFVWGVAGGQAFRPISFVGLVQALPPMANFASCGVGTEEVPAIMQSCMMGGHMRVGLEDNIRMPNGDLAKGNWELVELAARIAACLGRDIANPNEARKIMGIRES